MLSSLSEKFEHKIKTVEELVSLLGPRPRARKAIMCHGVLPGHLSNAAEPTKPAVKGSKIAEPPLELHGDPTN